MPRTSTWYPSDAYPELRFTLSGLVMIVDRDDAGHEYRTLLQPVRVFEPGSTFARYNIDKTPPRRSVSIGELLLHHYVGPPPHRTARPVAIDHDHLNLSPDNLKWSAAK